VSFLTATAPAEPSAEAMLKGRAVLPADTFADGPPSGSALGNKINGRGLPFDHQPVEGLSAVLTADNEDTYWAMSDNGYSTKEHSADFLLRMYRLRLDFETAKGGTGGVSVEGFVQLSDPDHHVPFKITNEDTTARLLTGADFDIESVRRDAQGDLWFGDEFGPFILHTDSKGRVLESPIPLEGVESPENPSLESRSEATLPTSKGFEGMAISEDKKHLYPMLEGSLKNDPRGNRRLIYEFDLESGRYTNRQWWYRTEAPEYSIGDSTALGQGRLLVIERDDEEGRAARFKKIYLVDLHHKNAEGFLVKREVLDLLSIRDPSLISEPGRNGDIGLGNPFEFPFRNPESILPLGSGRLLILNDNNYPISTGRNPDHPDNTEAIVVRTQALLDVSSLLSTERRAPKTSERTLLDLAMVMLLGILVLGFAPYLLRRRVRRR
jgi:hypothetical protein